MDLANLNSKIISDGENLYDSLTERIIKLESAEHDPEVQEVEIKPELEEDMSMTAEDCLYAANLVQVELTVKQEVIPDQAPLQIDHHEKESQKNFEFDKRKVSGLTIHNPLLHKGSLTCESLTSSAKCSDNQFICTVCKKGYKYKRGLTNHARKHYGYKLTCNICEATFTNSVVLKKHQQEEHPGVKLFPCPVCGKRYNQKYHLTYHLRVHSGDKPYSCDVCQQRFTSKYVLTYHLRLHNGDKRYACVHCDKRFIKKCALTNHIRVHTGDKPFACDICQKCFSQKTTLTDHLRGHSGEKRTFVCEVCSKVFYYKSHLNRHLIMHNTIVKDYDNTS